MALGQQLKQMKAQRKAQGIKPIRPVTDPGFVKPVKQAVKPASPFKAKRTLNPNATPYNKRLFTTSGTSPMATPGGGQSAQSPWAPAWNAEYEANVGNLNRNFADAQAQLGAKETSIKANYGFDPQYANDPYTRAAIMRDSWQKNRKATSTSSFARGHGYDGSTSNALNAADEAYGRDFDTAQREYQQELSGVTSDRLQADRDLREGIAAAEARRLEDAMDSYKELDTSDITLPEKFAKSRKKKGKKK